MNLVLLVCVIAALPYVSALLSRASRHAASMAPRDTPRMLENGTHWIQKDKYY
jgi:hypothetical protein